jgi:hypothetical protein
VRILKRGEKGDQYADVDGAFGFAARLDNIERAQITVDRKLDDMNKRLGTAAEPFNQVTRASLEQNETVLRNISDRTAYLETEFGQL